MIAKPRHPFDQMISDTINDNLLLIRATLLIVTASSAFLLLRSSRHSKQFKKISDIPSTYFTEHTRLGGVFKVKKTDQELPLIYFYHVPLLKRIMVGLPTGNKLNCTSYFFLVINNEDCLQVNWKSVKATPGSKDSIIKALNGKVGKLQLYPTEPTSSSKVTALIQIKSHSYSPIRRDPAIPLLREGLLTFEHDDNDRLWTNEVVRMIIAQAYGKRMRKGVWKNESDGESGIFVKLYQAVQDFWKKII